MSVRITKIRVEMKYRIAAEQIKEILEQIPPGDSRSYRMTTTYFDRPDRSLSRAALETPMECTKIRLREYVEDSASLWIEVKTRIGAWTRKSRFRIRPESVRPLLEGAEAGLPDLACSCGACLRDHADAIHRFRVAAAGGLVPVGCVCAFRRTFARSDCGLRLSLDENVGYFRPPDRLYQGSSTLTSEALGPALFQEPRAVLEVKGNGTLPRWCGDLVAGLDREEYSKFRTLLRCLEQAPRVASGVD